MAKSKKHILVVDDEPAWLQILLYILQKKGYEVRGESSAAAALETLKTYKPDMIVSDVRMPDMNGFDFLDRVKRSRRTSRTPFVFISAIDDEESKNAARNLGATDYLTKPFDEDDVVRILGKHLDES